MIVTAIILAVIIGVLEALGWGMREPWRRVAIIGVVILLVAGVIMLLFPGVLPIRVGGY